MRYFWMAAVLAFAPGAAFAATPAAVGVGPHGYDWLIGTWTCKNVRNVAIGGPQKQTITFTPVNGSIAVRVTGNGFERSGYIAFDRNAKKWWKPIVYPNGNHYVESTVQTGAKTVWVGPYTDVASGKTFLVRDTYAVASASQYADLGQYQTESGWKTGYEGVCRKND